MSNDAADEALGLYRFLVELSGGTFIEDNYRAVLDAALAAESLATVERIRVALNAVTFHDPAARHHVFALLDGEANGLRSA